MSTSALAFMIITWTVTVGFTGFCFWKLLTSDKALGGDECDEI